MNPKPPPTSLPGKLLALVAGVILLVLGFMFSLVLLVVFVAVGLLLGAWFFWKTRHVRKAMNEARMAGHPPAGRQRDRGRSGRRRGMPGHRNASPARRYAQAMSRRLPL
jgi:UPF0716 family protein affecting phage T7 exclusion